MKDSLKNSYNRLMHIQKAIAEIERFTVGCTELNFIKDEILVSAVLFQFSVIGEAIVHVDSVILPKYAYPCT